MRKEIPAEVVLILVDSVHQKIRKNSMQVYEDELCMAFRDVNPVAPTHILIIPKKHIPMVGFRLLPQRS